MMQKTENLQEQFLIQCRRDRIPVTVFLVNGFQMRGLITGYDSFVLLLDADGKQEMVYKHAVSTVMPVQPIPLTLEQPV